MPPLLGLADVHVRYRRLDALHQGDDAAGWRTLSPEERDRAARFVFDRDRSIFVAAHVLLRRALSDYEDVPPEAWEFSPGAYGKPQLAGRHRGVPLRFNLAHTHGLVACAVSRTMAVGVDAESLHAGVRSLEIARRFFSASEIRDLQRCDDASLPVRFIEIWTLKEAYIKAIGAGLSHPLASFSVHLDDRSRIRFESGETSGEPSAWRFALFTPSPGHRMAVAVNRAKAEPCHIAAWADEDAPAPLTADRMSAP